MSSFLGNSLRGSFFLLLGLWWSVKYPTKYVLQKMNAGDQAKLWIQCTDVIEGTAKACIALGGILAEQFVPNGPHMSLYDEGTQNWVHLMNWQHMTMYLFFGLSGVLDVLSFTPLKLPVGLDRLLVALALFTEGFLFYFHDYQGAVLTEHLYSLLSIAVFGAALVSLLEVFLRDHTILEVFRASLFVLQGSWFWQIGFVLHPPWGGAGWSEGDAGNKNFLTMSFFWHYAASLLVVAISGSIIPCLLGGMLMQYRFRLSEGLDLLLLSLALFNEGMIFIVHHAMSTPLTKHVHFMLLIPIFSAAFCLLLEVYFRDHPVLTLFRISMFLLQGTWFWQIAFILWPPWGAPTWDQNDPEAVMFITICFSWHYLVIICLLSLIYGIVYCYFNRKRKYEAANAETDQFNQDRSSYLLLSNKYTEV